MDENPHEDAARWQKIAKLLAVLYKHEIPTHRVRYLGWRQWRTIAAAARVNPPSTTTVRMLCRTLRCVMPPKKQPQNAQG